MRLLVAASPLPDGRALVRTGATVSRRPLVWAFTDEEALAAWDRRPAEAVIELEHTELPALSNEANLLVALNAAGPGACLVETGAPPSPDGELTTPEQRGAIRRRAREADELGRRALAAGSLEEARLQFERAVAACGEIGDRLHGAAASLELARTLAQTDALESALPLWERAAEVFALFGEADLALLGLLEAAEAAAANGLLADAERLSVGALTLATGDELADRLVAVWRSVDGH